VKHTNLKKKHEMHEILVKNKNWKGKKQKPVKNTNWKHQLAKKKEEETTCPLLMEEDEKKADPKSTKTDFDVTFENP
jgi:hypothetical protein